MYIYDDEKYCISNGSIIHSDSSDKLVAEINDTRIITNDNFCIYENSEIRFQGLGNSSLVTLYN